MKNTYKMKKKSFLFAACLVGSALSYGQAISLSGTHNWSDGSAWTSGSVPLMNDDVTISAGSTINLIAPLVHGADIEIANNGSLNSSIPANSCTVNDGDVTLLGLGASVYFLGSGAPVPFTIDEGNLINWGLFMVGDFELINTSGTGFSLNNGDFSTANVEMIGDLLFENNTGMFISFALTVDSSTIDNNSVINCDEITNDGTINNYSSVNVSDAFENYGTYYSNGDGTFIVHDFINDVTGTATVEDSMNVGQDFGNEGTFTNDSGSVVIQNDFYNDGTVDGSGWGSFLISANSENTAAGIIDGDINICDTTLSTQYLDVVAGTIDFLTVNFCGVSYASIGDHSELNTFAIYPNPATNMVSIKGIESGNVAIYSIEGRLVYEGKYSANEQIDISSINAGVYVLKYSSSDIQSTTTLIVK
ncbi:MAG: hypothetical protein ACI865_003286 [Flavobacteriaceae bacterium]|jgi:hypothetical protein